MINWLERNRDWIVATVAAVAYMTGVFYRLLVKILLAAGGIFLWLVYNATPETSLFQISQWMHSPLVGNMFVVLVVMLYGLELAFYGYTGRVITLSPSVGARGDRHG